MLTRVTPMRGLGNRALSSAVAAHASNGFDVPFARTPIAMPSDVIVKFSAIRPPARKLLPTSRS